MKAFGYTKNSKTLTASSIQAIELDTPTANGHDLLIEVKAISVNPVDTKIRANVTPEQGYKVLGWDGVGIVKPLASRFRYLMWGIVYFTLAIYRAKAVMRNFN